MMATSGSSAMPPCGSTRNCQNLTGQLALPETLMPSSSFCLASPSLSLSDVDVEVLQIQRGHVSTLNIDVASPPTSANRRRNRRNSIFVKPKRLLMFSGN
ncbi:hypothetical protein HanHA300_Chr16g0627441 [Helianthus annuus]|nr:hypothetical protein HanHA300_Chr16g0627441 [Helianthus annuus]KAJ0642414.1 hypothetical protein HanLR1_Chr16g0638001 [Helianthus annuus]